MTETKGLHGLALMSPTNAICLTQMPLVSRYTMRLLMARHMSMQHWQAIANRAGKNTYEHETWERRVDFFFDEIERVIFRIAHNPLDHGRREAA